MICCFFNSLSGLFVLLSVAGAGSGLAVMRNKYVLLSIFLLQSIFLIYFIRKAIMDRKKAKYVLLMSIGFLLTNFSYFPKIMNNMKYCKHCPNKNSHESCTDMCDKNCSKHNKQMDNNDKKTDGTLDQTKVLENKDNPSNSPKKQKKCCKKKQAQMGKNDKDLNPGENVNKSNDEKKDITMEKIEQLSKNEKSRRSSNIIHSIISIIGVFLTILGFVLYRRSSSHNCNVKCTTGKDKDCKKKNDKKDDDKK